jgi:hypothetical protein
MLKRVSLLIAYMFLGQGFQVVEDLLLPGDVPKNVCE